MESGWQFFFTRAICAWVTEKSINLHNISKDLLWMQMKSGFMTK